MALTHSLKSLGTGRNPYQGRASTHTDKSPRVLPVDQVAGVG
jgi:hypothetical protein